MSFFKAGISQQLMLGIIVVHTVLMTGFIFDLVHRQHAFLIQQNHDQAIALAETLASNSISWVLANDFIGMEEIITSQSQYPDLRYAMLLDPQGKVLAYTNRDQVGRYVTDSVSLSLLSAPIGSQTLMENDQLIDVAHPILIQDRLIAWARVGINRESIEENLELVTVNGLIYTVVAVLVGMLFAWIVAKSLTRDLRLLTQRTHAISQGKRDVSFSLRRQDELGQLANDLSRMVQILADNEQSLFKERERALVTLHSIGDGVISTFADGRIEYLNPVAEELTGWSNEQAREEKIENVFPLVDERSLEIIPSPVYQALEFQETQLLSRACLLLNRYGKKIAVEDSAAPIRDTRGQMIGAVLVFRNVTESRRLQQQIEHQARHDALTGLWNRHAFDEYLHHLVDNVHQDSNQHHALIYIDLDQFKIVNDTAGHLAGDEMLRLMAVLLKAEIRESDTVARLGGDEFGVILTGCNQAHALKIADNIRQSLMDYRFSWDGQPFQTGASIGVVMINQQLPNDNVLALADLACYAAKEQGRNRVHLYHPSDEDLIQRRSEMQWLGRIKNALEANRVVLFIQRIKAMQPSAQRPDLYEVLVRLQDDNDELIEPSLFIPAAERYGLMNLLDKAVVTKAFEWLNKNDAYCLSINLSGLSMSDKDVLHTIESLLDQYPHFAERLCFEITETAAISNIKDATEFMQRLKARKVRFALDDFGSGLSSFSYLKTLPVDYLKIDGSFVRDIVHDPIDAAMVEAISKVSREMGILTIAEFVEHADTIQCLKDLGVDYVQGYEIDYPQRMEH